MSTQRLVSLVALMSILTGCVPGPASKPAQVSSTPTSLASAAPTAGSSGSTAVPTLPPTSSPVPTPTPVQPTVGPGPTRTPASSPLQSPTHLPTLPPVTPTPTPPSPGSGQSVYVTAGSRSSKMVALTFDFGGRVGDALAIVNDLATWGVAATVFSTGDEAGLSSTDATVRQVFDVVCSTASSFAVGNHSMTHPDFTGLATTQMATQLTDAQASIARACPAKSPLPLFRPPFGALGGWQTATFYRILDAVGAVGYSRTVTWDIDTLDWGAPGTGDYRTTDQIVAKVEGSVRGGSIVLMHLGGYNTDAAIGVLVPWLRSHGFELVDLHRMLGV